MTTHHSRCSNENSSPCHRANEGRTGESGAVRAVSNSRADFLPIKDERAERESRSGFVRRDFSGFERIWFHPPHLLDIISRVIHY
jgi:hypothetical protein